MMTRREALQTTTLIAAGALVAGPALSSAHAQPAPAPSGPHKLPPLPYAFDALEPHIDAQTMQIHHDKHHQAYVTNLNKALAGRDDLRLGQETGIGKGVVRVDRFPAFGFDHVDDVVKEKPVQEIEMRQDCVLDGTADYATRK